MMFKYRKKPVVIEAVQLSSLDGEHTQIVPRWLMEALTSGVVYADGEITKIKTLEGDHICGKDDYIIRGVKGELYPCKPDIFAATYDKEMDDA